MLDPTVLHQNILADVEAKTGWHFQSVDEVNVSVGPVSPSVVLPSGNSH
jgi:hypothetical protein